MSSANKNSYIIIAIPYDNVRNVFNKYSISQNLANNYNLLSNFPVPITSNITSYNYLNPMKCFYASSVDSCNPVQCTCAGN